MMPKFNQFFLMDTEDVKRYTVEVLNYFQSDEPICCAEIGDGNINYVFKVWSKKDGRSVIVKQADKLLRSSGRPLDIYRNKIEAGSLKIQKSLAPNYIPEVFYYDEIMAAVSMEDISCYGNLRKELMMNHIYEHLSGNLAKFFADVLLPTTDLVMNRQEKKAQVKFFSNPELCDITEDLVLTEPYDNYRNRNIVTKGNESFVEEHLYHDEALKAEVAELRNGFMNHAQALIHGDLHSGSIFANVQGIKIIDPEFAFYGPMGYDIGNVIGNLFFALANKVYTAAEQKQPIRQLENLIVNVYDQTRGELSKKYDEIVTHELYRNARFKQHYLDGVMADALGYAGTEMIRRVVGDSKVMEVTSVEDPKQRIPMERALIKQGIALIKQRKTITSGKEIMATFRLILA